MTLQPIDSEDLGTVYMLYQLLQEREPSACISHKKMPSLIEHMGFVNEHPYVAWYGIRHLGMLVGATYLTTRREIGVGILKAHHGFGFGKQAIEMLMQRHPGNFLANINPQNERSVSMFAKLGFHHIQNTYSKD